MSGRGAWYEAKVECFVVDNDVVQLRRLGSAQLVMEEIGYELCRVATLNWLSR